jgi:hypothetical protein
MKIMKPVATPQATIVPTFQVRGIALLLFTLPAGEFDPAEDEEAAAGEAEDPLDEEVLGVVFEAGVDTAAGWATGVDGVELGVEGPESGAAAAGAAGDGDGVGVGVAVGVADAC